MSLGLLIRNLIYWLGVAVLTPLCFAGMFVFCWLPRRKRHIFGQTWAVSLLWLIQHVVGPRSRVVGAGNITAVPSIICYKHQSGWETLALQKIFPPQIYVAKRELLWIPLFGWGLWLTNAIMINRSDRANANRQMLEQGLARKELGFWITVFPEGTRVRPGAPGKYKLGAARMAKQLDMPLVPVAHNAGEFWPRNAFFKHPGEITVVIGEPILPEAETGPEGLMKQAEAWIEARQREIGGAGPYADPKERAARRACVQPA